MRINLKTDKYLSVFKFIRIHKLPFVNRFWCPHVNVKQCRDELNKMCKIEPLNAKFEGAKVTSVETVFKIHISDFLKQNSDFDPITDKIKIKINGDGARMTRNLNFLAFSGSILHISFSSSRHCLTFTCGHQKRFTNGNLWMRINLKTDKYLYVFKFIRIRVDVVLVKCFPSNLYSEHHVTFLFREIPEI